MTGETPTRPGEVLSGVLTWSLFGSVFVLATVLWVTVHPLAGALGLIVPFAVWYAAIAKAAAVDEQRARMDAARERDRRPMARTEPEKPTLAEGGAVAPAPWRP